MGENMFASQSGCGERNRASRALGVLSSERVLLQVTNDFHQAVDAGWRSAVILLARSVGFNPAPLRFDRLLQKAAVRAT